MTMSNGNLVRAQFSEIASTIEILDAEGVTPEDFAYLRSAGPAVRSTVAKVIKRDETLWSLLEIVQDETKLGLVLAYVRGAADIVVKAAAPAVDKIIEKVEQVAKKFAVWIRTKVGGLTKAQIVEKLNDTDAGNGMVFKLSDYARNLLDKKECTVKEKAEEAEFATASLRELGFKETPTTKEFMNNEFLAKFDLELCRPDDGPSIRLAYRDQPNGEWLPIAMK